MNTQANKADIGFCLVVMAIIVILAVWPTGFSPYVTPNSVRTVARVEEVDNSTIFNAGGLINLGHQTCQVTLLQGPFQGERAAARNNLTGRLEFDKVFMPGERALAVVEYDGDRIREVTLIDHYRIGYEIVLFGLFALLLIVFARWTGLKALLSFTLTVLCIWKVLVPYTLRGVNPMLLAMVLVGFLTVVVILLVGGLNGKSLAAIGGSLSGTVLTAVMALAFSRLFHMHGAVIPFAESLLYAGYAHLKLSDILVAVVFIGSAGALMDLAMDISASVFEVVSNRPDISTRAAITSGVRVGRAVVGTMTTTLLFAYTGGYLALLMVFMAQGTPVVDILNLRYVSKEIMQTIVGSFGLVAVAPLTAVIAGVLATRSATSDVSDVASVRRR